MALVITGSRQARTYGSDRGVRVGGKGCLNSDIPFFCVEAVVEVPYGSAPHECSGMYEPFYNHMDQYAKLTREKGIDGAEEYLEKHVYSPNSWDDYLGLIGIHDVIEATKSGRRMYSD